MLISKILIIIISFLGAFGLIANAYNTSKEFDRFLSFFVMLLGLVAALFIAIFGYKTFNYVDTLPQQNQIIQEETDMCCDNCGTEVLEEYNYCFECGENLK